MEEFVSNHVKFVLNEVVAAAMKAIDQGNGQDEEEGEEEEEEESPPANKKAAASKRTNSGVDKALVAAGCRLAPSTGHVLK